MINHYVTGPVTRAFSDDVTAAILVFQDNETAATLMFLVLWELASFLMQTNSFVPVNLQGCWSRE